MDKIAIYMTAPNKAEAEQIVRSLLSARLIACANVTAPVTSHYWWGGQIETSEEVSVIMKSTSALYPKVEAVIKAQHSYDCPAIVSWALTQGNAEYFDWIDQETQKNA